MVFLDYHNVVALGTGSTPRRFMNVLFMVQSPTVLCGSFIGKYVLSYTVSVDLL